MPLFPCWQLMSIFHYSLVSNSCLYSTIPLLATHVHMSIFPCWQNKIYLFIWFINFTPCVLYYSRDRCYISILLRNMFLDCIYKHFLENMFLYCICKHFLKNMFLYCIYKYCLENMFLTVFTNIVWKICSCTVFTNIVSKICFYTVFPNIVWKICSYTVFTNIVWKICSYTEFTNIVWKICFYTVFTNIVGKWSPTKYVLKVFFLTFLALIESFSIFYDVFFCIIKVILVLHVNLEKQIISLKNIFYSQTGINQKKCWSLSKLLLLL